VVDASIAPPQTGPLSGAGLRRVLAALCLTEITSWGILYYAFTVLSVGGSPTSVDSWD